MTLTTQQVTDQLVDARASYHDLVTGKAARVVVDQNGERVEFTPASRQQLYIYIQDLERLLAVSSPSVPSRGPAGFVF